MFPVHLPDAWLMVKSTREAQKDAIHPTPVFELLGLALEDFVDKAMERTGRAMGNGHVMEISWNYISLYFIEPCKIQTYCIYILYLMCILWTYSLL